MDSVNTRILFALAELGFVDVWGRYARCICQLQMVGVLTTHGITRDISLDLYQPSPIFLRLRMVNICNDLRVKLQVQL